MSVWDKKLLLVIFLVSLAFCALFFYSRLTWDESSSNDVSTELKEARRLLSSRLNIVARNQAVSTRLNQLQAKFLNADDLEQAQVKLLREVEKTVLAAGLAVSQKNVVGYSKPVIGVNLEGTTIPDKFFRFLQMVTEARVGLKVQRLQAHVLPDSKLLSYQITLTTLLIDKEEGKR